MCVSCRGAKARCVARTSQVWGGPQGFLTTGRAAGRGSSTHHPRRLLQALQSEHPLMYQGGWCSWISYQKHQIWPCEVAVCITAGWVLLGPQEASVFLQTLLSTSSVGHCVLLEWGSFLSSFLLFSVSFRLLKNTIPPGPGAHFSLPSFLSYFL